jgi:hypothetical protein
MTITACIHQLNNARRQLKDVLKEDANNGAYYEVEVSTARVEKKFLHLTDDNVVCAIEREEKIELEVKARENRRNTQGSFRKLGRQIRGHVNDLRVLPMIMVHEFPPLRRLRGSSRAKVRYAFGDSSGNGFGWSIDFGKESSYEHGLGSETLREEHSNYRESNDLVNAFMRKKIEGRFNECAIFLYRDNQVAEGAYCQCTGVNLFLFELLAEIDILQMKYDIMLHVIWIAGTWMIQQGMYDL